MLWVAQKGLVRKYEFANPAQETETTLEEPANLDKVPKPILDALRAALDGRSVRRRRIGRVQPEKDSTPTTGRAPRFFRHKGNIWLAGLD